MLRLMLDSHPHISNPGEFDFLVDMLGARGETPDMVQYRRWLSMNRSFQSSALVLDPRLNYVELMHSFVQQLSKAGKVLTINVHRHFDRLRPLFPQAEYLHLIRDPRDVARSSIGMGWAGNIYSGVDIWTSAERSWDRLRTSLRADQQLEVRYEALVDDPVAELTRVCQFLGLEYSPSMLDYSARSTYAPPDGRLKYQWKSHCSPRELQLVDWKLGELLLQRNYQQSGPGASRPALMELLMIALEDKYRRVAFRIRRYGFALYLESLLASRVRISAWQQSCQSRIERIDLTFLK